MKHFIVDYLTRDGEHEYTEHGVLSARSSESAYTKAARGRKFFTRYGWEEFCERSGVYEIPKADFEVLGKYFLNIDRLLTVHLFWKLIRRFGSLVYSELTS